MIKSIAQYVVVCDNSFCDSVVKSVKDLHSIDCRIQFEEEINKLGWKFKDDKNNPGQQNLICPGCLPLVSELEKKIVRFRPIRKSVLTAF